MNDKNQTFARFSMMVGEDGIEKLRTSSLIAQTPLPSKSKKVSIVGGKDIVVELLNEGFSMNEIEEIRIGYSWTTSSENNQIVEFIPTWYIKIKNRWKTLSELKNEKKAGDTVNKQTVGGEGDGF